MKTIFLSLAVIGWMVPASAFAAEIDENVVLQADEITRHPEQVDLRKLKDPKNSKVVAELRKQAADSSRSDARIPLLALGDPEILDLCLREYRSEDTFNRGQAARQLSRSNNPAVIPLVAADLFRNESTTTIFVPPEFRLKPVSVYAGAIICSVLAANESFSRDTRDWAASLSRQTNETRDLVREDLRRWWSENKKYFTDARYSEVRPPRDSSALRGERKSGKTGNELDQAATGLRQARSSKNVDEADWLMKQIVERWSPVNQRESDLVDLMGPPDERRSGRIVYKLDSGFGGWEWIFYITREKITKWERNSID
jgi:hypothetical protein